MYVDASYILRKYTFGKEKRLIFVDVVLYRGFTYHVYLLSYTYTPVLY